MERQEKYIDRVIEAAKKRGLETRIRDIAYALLRVSLDDAFVAHSVVFGTPKDNDIQSYESLDNIRFLIQWFEDELSEKATDKDPMEMDIDAILSSRAKDTTTDITFEENKAAMVELIARTEEALSENRIELDKGLKIITDLRTKLNDKFKVEERSKEQYIIVQPKHNKICPHTRKECWEMSEEYAKQKFHLIKDPKYKS